MKTLMNKSPVWTPDREEGRELVCFRLMQVASSGDMKENSGVREKEKKKKRARKISVTSARRSRVGDERQTKWRLGDFIIRTCSCHAILSL